MKLITNKHVLAPGIQGWDIRTNKFKTTRISVHFVLPLSLEDTAKASLLSRLLSRSTKEYNTPVLLQRKLLSLYGAGLSSHVTKVGDMQILSVTTTVLSDEYALQEERLTVEATELLCNCLFFPNCDNEEFLDADFQVCKRLLIESLEGIINDKRKYAISQMFSNMCQDEPFGIEIGGDIGTVQKTTSKEVYDFWMNMLETAPVVVTVVGTDSSADIYNKISEKFNSIKRSPITTNVSFSKKTVTEPKEITEAMQLTQGKLVLGFRSNVSSLSQDNLALRMMCDIFGGAPYSKLFTVVREKMSLCYYCAARLQSQKGFICVDSGVETCNIKATKQGILDQLSAIQRGEFDAQVITASKMSLADSARSVTDSQGSIETWYLSRMFDCCDISPDEFIENLEKVTKEDIVNAATNVVLDTVYILKPTEEVQ